MLDSVQIAWLAGLLEGEAYFACHKGNVYIQLAMTDEDVVKNAASLMNGSKMSKPYRPKGKETYKMVYGCRLHGQPAINIMQMIYPYMGERRQSKIQELFESWSRSTYKPRAPKGTPHPPAPCHPDKPYRAKGLCKECYMRQWRANRANS